MTSYETVEEAARAADAWARRYGGVWVVHAVVDSARTRFRFVAVNAVTGWHLPVSYRTDTGYPRPWVATFPELPVEA